MDEQKAEVTEDKPVMEEPRRDTRPLVISDSRFQNICTLVSADLRRRFLKFYKRVQDKKDRDFGVEYGSWLGYMLCQEIINVEGALSAEESMVDIRSSFVAVINHVLLSNKSSDGVEPSGEEPKDNAGTDAPKA